MNGMLTNFKMLSNLFYFIVAFLVFLFVVIAIYIIYKYVGEEESKEGQE